MRKFLLLVALLSTVSCSGLNNLGRRVNPFGRGGDSAVTLEELRLGLLDFSSTFGILVTDAADRISGATTEPRIRRLSLLWRIRMPPMAQQAATDINPRTGFVEMLTVAVSQRQYFEDGAGSTLFGDHQAIALEAAKEIESSALRGGALFLSPAQLAALHVEVEQLAKENPIRGEFLRENIRIGLQRAERRGAFDDIISIPMAPFRVFAGVESGAQAIRDFNATAAQFTTIVDQLPQRLRWQMELLSYDLQERGGVLEQSLRSLESVAESANRLSLVAQQAPEDARQMLLSVSEELEQRSATLKAVLDAYRQAIADTGSTAANIAPLIDGLTKTSEQLNQAVVASTALVAEFNAPSPPLPPGSPPPTPFNIADYERTAIAIRATAEELRELIASARLSEESIAGSIADRLLRNGLILIAAFFVGLLAYRLISARIPRAR
jgi:hypothetical protein